MRTIIHHFNLSLSTSGFKLRWGQLRIPSIWIPSYQHRSMKMSSKALPHFNLMIRVWRIQLQNSMGLYLGLSHGETRESMCTSSLVSQIKASIWTGLQGWPSPKFTLYQYKAGHPIFHWPILAETPIPGLKFQWDMQIWCKRKKRAAVLCIQTVPYLLD